MTVFIDSKTIKASADYFREHTYQKPEQIGLFLYFKSIGMNPLFSCDYPKWGSIAQDQKRSLLRTVYDLSGDFDVINEAGGKNSSIFPFSFVPKENYSKEKFYNAATAFQTIGSRITDTLDNSLEDTLFKRIDSKRIKLANNYIEIIKNYHLNGQKIPLKHIVVWFLKFWELDLGNEFTNDDINNVCVLKFLKVFHILPDEFEELFIYDEGTTIGYTNERIKGAELRDIIDIPDSYAPEISPEPRREYMPSQMRLVASEASELREAANGHLTKESINRILKEWSDDYLQQNYSRYVSEVADEILSHNLFGIHIKQKNTALSDEQPHICIGWSRLGDMSGITSYDELAELYDAHYDKEPRSRGQDLGQIWRFVHDLQAGDFIVYAEEKICHIGLITSDYYFDKKNDINEDEDYKNKRDVFWLKNNIQRSSLSTDFHRSLSAAMSLWKLNEYRAVVFDLLKNTYIKDEVDIVEEAGETVNSPQSQKDSFRAWMTQQKKDDGNPYSQNTINSYIYYMERGYSTFSPFKECNSPFEIIDYQELSEYTAYLFNVDGWNEFNENAGNKACEYGFKRYGDFLRWKADKTQLVFNSNLDCSKPRNRIFFGAPGTGKSYTLNKETEALVNNMHGYYERVTFHPDYSYSQFVGVYKPVPTINKSNNKSEITYSYVPGPFIRTLAKALENAMREPVAPHILIVEEINRANVAAVFGDVFQLLDRNENNCSQYSIHASEDMKLYLSKRLNTNIENCAEIKIPDNMFIWATMNSADQGVFPMDTAFKRRWDFKYIGIDEGDEKIRGKFVTLGKGDYERTIEWNELRKAINDVLYSNEYRINEDKMLGAFFLSSKVVPFIGEIDNEIFIDAFKSKVIMYLFEDAAKQKRHLLFSGCSNTTKYSSICNEFDAKGVFIFCEAIHDRFSAQLEGKSEDE